MLVILRANCPSSSSVSSKCDDRLPFIAVVTVNVMLNIHIHDVNMIYDMENPTMPAYVCLDAAS